MCKMIFIGVSERLDERPWEKDTPDFYVSLLEQEELSVRTKFALPFIYQVGSSMGCACDLFKYNEVPDEHDSDRRRFYDLVNSQLAAGKKVEIYTCWAGDYETPADAITNMGAARIGADFYYEDRELKIYVSS